MVRAIDGGKEGSNSASSVRTVLVIAVNDSCMSERWAQHPRGWGRGSIWAWAAAPRFRAGGLGTVEGPRAAPPSGCRCLASKARGGPAVEAAGARRYGVVSALRCVEGTAEAEGEEWEDGDGRGDAGPGRDRWDGMEWRKLGCGRRRGERGWGKGTSRPARRRRRLQTAPTDALAPRPRVSTAGVQVVDEQGTRTRRTEEPMICSWAETFYDGRP